MLTDYAIVKDVSAEVLASLLEGGAGSGNWGHKGRPGRRGGSLPGGGKGGGVSAHASGGDPNAGIMRFRAIRSKWRAEEFGPFKKLTGKAREARIAKLNSIISSASTRRSREKVARGDDDWNKVINSAKREIAFLKGTPGGRSGSGAGRVSPHVAGGGKPSPEQLAKQELNWRKNTLAGLQARRKELIGKGMGPSGLHDIDRQIRFQKNEIGKIEKRGLVPGGMKSGLSAHVASGLEKAIEKTAKSVVGSEKGSFRLPKLSGKLWRAARTARNVEVTLSGSPTKMLKRLVNRAIGRNVVSRLYR